MKNEIVYRLRLARLNEEMREDNEIAQGKIFLRVLHLFFLICFVCLFVVVVVVVVVLIICEFKEW